MSLDTDDGRRSKRGYGRTRIEAVYVFVAQRLELYANWARVDVKRLLFGRWLVVQVLHKNVAESP